MSCPFCSVDSARIIAADEYSVALNDGYPISPGHSLVIPKRHVASMTELSLLEMSSLWSLLAQVRRGLDLDRKPDGYNIGINDGKAAGQTVMHLHVHLIPRYEGDQVDPRGGVRWVVPEKADYWSAHQRKDANVPPT